METIQFVGGPFDGAVAAQDQNFPHVGGHVGVEESDGSLVFYTFDGAVLRFNADATNRGEP